MSIHTLTSSSTPRNVAWFPRTVIEQLFTEMSLFLYNDTASRRDVVNEDFSRLKKGFFAMMRRAAIYMSVRCFCTATWINEIIEKSTFSCAQSSFLRPGIVKVYGERYGEVYFWKNTKYLLVWINISFTLSPRGVSLFFTFFLFPLFGYSSGFRKPGKCHVVPTNHLPKWFFNQRINVENHFQTSESANGMFDTPKQLIYAMIHSFFFPIHSKNKKEFKNLK